MSRLGKLLLRGAIAPFRLLIAGNPWLRLIVIGVPILLLLFFLGPVVSLVTKLIELTFQVMAPFFANPAGRLVLLNLLLIAAVLVTWLAVRNRVRRMLSGWLLKRHLDGIVALVGGDEARAEELFTKVARSTREAPHEYPDLVVDAQLKLGRLALQRGAVDQALLWLARVREKGLRKDLHRSLVQLRAEAFLAQGGILPEAVEQSLRDALEAFPDDRKLLTLLRSVLVGRGAFVEASEQQERLHSRAPAHQKEAARATLLADLAVAGEAALANGDLAAVKACAKRARSADPDAPIGGVLLGKLAALEGEPRAALKQWGRTRSHQALQLMGDILAKDGQLMSTREIVNLSPTHGTLLLIAKLYAQRGEGKKALRAVRHVARALGPTPEVVLVLKEVLESVGETAEAARVCEEAVLRLLAQEPKTG